MQKTYTLAYSRTRCVPCHTNAHTLSLNLGGNCRSHPISKLAQCITKPELIHILSLDLCFIVRHSFCYSHRRDKETAISCIKLFASASPFVCWLLLCWSVDGLQLWPQSPSDKRERKQRGMGITSFRWPSTDTQGGKMRGSVGKKTLKG